MPSHNETVITALVQAVFNSVLDLCSFSVIESVECAYEISCYSSDPLESYTFSDLSVYVLDDFVIHLGTSISLPAIIYSTLDFVKLNLHILLYLFCTKHIMLCFLKMQYPISVNAVTWDRNTRILHSQLVEPLDRNRLALTSAASRTYIIDDSGISADRVSVYWMID